MTNTDALLKRLLKAATAAPRPETSETPFALEARVLSAWRSSRSADDWAGLLKFLRVGLSFASVLTLAIIALGLRDIVREQRYEFALPVVTVRLALSQ
jgi:hypothetical protein